MVYNNRMIKKEKNGKTNINPTKGGIYIGFSFMFINNNINSFNNNNNNSKSKNKYRS